MTFEERYQLGYAKGLRIGKCESYREMLIRSVNIIARDEGVKVGKALFKK